MIASALLRVRLLRLRNGILPRRGRTRSRLGAAVFAMALVTLLGLLVTFALAALFVTLTQHGAGPRDAATVLGIIFSAALAGLLVFDLHETVTTLLVDSDIDLLRRAPLSPATLFAIKLIEALPRTSVLLLVLAVPSVFAFHAFFRLPWWAWLALPVQLLSLWAIPLGFGIAAALLALRRLPARYAREGLGLLSTLALFLLWLANSFVLPRVAATAEDPIASVHALLRSMPQGYALSPGTWLADALSAAAEGRAMEAVRWTALLVASAAASLTLAGVTSAAHIEIVQLRMTGGGNRGRARPRGRIRVEDAAAPAGFLATVLRRDATLIARNWTVLGDLVTAAALWTLLPLVGRPLFAFTSSTIARTMLLALTVALGYEIAARAIPIERRGVTWMNLAPVSPWRWALARYTGIAMLATLVMGFACLGIALALRLGAFEVVRTLLVVVPALATTLAVGLWTSAAFGNPQWTNPRAMLTLAGRAVATFLLLVQAGGWIALAAVLDTKAWSGAWWLPAVVAAIATPLALRGAALRIGRIA